MDDIGRDLESAYDEIQAKKEREEELKKFLDCLYDTYDPQREEFLGHLFKFYKKTEPLWKFLDWLRFWRWWRLG